MKVGCFRIIPEVEEYPLTVRDGLVKDYYETGVPQKISSYKNGRRDGEFTEYYGTGIKERVTFYKNDRRDGACSEFYENDKPESEERYRDDVLISPKEWDKAGKLVTNDEFDEDGARKAKAKTAR